MHTVDSVTQVTERGGQLSGLIHSGHDDSEAVDVLSVLLLLAKRKRLIGLVTGATFIVSLIVVLLLKPTFTATAVILPPQQQQASSSLLGQLGSLAALGGGASALGIKSPADLYIGILQSRTIADEIIAQFKLQTLYKQKRMQSTRAVLKANTKLDTGKDGLIQIAVTDTDARRASDIANAYVAALYKMNSELAISEAAQRRVFFDQQMDGEKKALALAEEDLRATQQRTGLIQLSGQAEMIIRTIAELRAQIASREVELQSIRTFATEENPDVTRLQEEISTMRAQLAKLENDQDRPSQLGNIAVPAGRVPQDSLEYARKFREVKYHETLFELLSRQYESARIDEAKSAPIIQVIDRAVPIDKKSGPKRAYITLGCTLAAFVMCCAWIFVGEGLRRISKSPEQGEKFRQLALTLRGRS